MNINLSSFKPFLIFGQSVRYMEYALPFVILSINFFIDNNNLDNTPILGSAVSACGRLMLAEYFYEKDHLNIHRNYLSGNNLQLHGWNRFIAEKAAMQHAELAMKRNNQDFTASRIRSNISKAFRTLPYTS